MTSNRDLPFLSERSVWPWSGCVCGGGLSFGVHSILLGLLDLSLKDLLHICCISGVPCSRLAL